MDTLSFILCTLALSAIIGSFLVKGKQMRLILILVFSGNILYALGYLAGGSGIGGSASCFLGAALSFVKYFYDVKGKPLPKWILGIFLATFVALNVYLAGISLPTGLMLLAVFAFVMGIIQPNGAKYRLWCIANALTWCVYDVVTHSIGALPSHIAQLAFLLVGIFLYDIPKAHR